MEKLLPGVAVVTGNAARAAKRRRVFIVGKVAFLNRRKYKKAFL